MSVLLTSLKGIKVDPKKEFWMLVPKEGGMSAVEPHITNVHHRLSE